MLQAIGIGERIPMLEPWIIEQIRRREEERRRGERPRLDLPVSEESWSDDRDQDVDLGQEIHRDPSTERGVVIIGM